LLNYLLVGVEHRKLGSLMGDNPLDTRSPEEILIHVFGDRQVQVAILFGKLKYRAIHMVLSQGTL
jgi:hypothetical protein